MLPYNSKGCDNIIKCPSRLHFCLSTFSRRLLEEEFAGAVYMVEQPFPVGVEHTDARDDWIPIKDAFMEAGIYVYADERYSQELLV